jgi:hypothetical protein
MDLEPHIFHPLPNFSSNLNESKTKLWKTLGVGVTPHPIDGWGS